MSTLQRKGRDISIDQYRIEDARVAGEWKDVSNIEVTLTDIQTDEKVTVHALKYGWLYKYITNEESGELSVENSDSVIQGVSVNGIIITFGKSNQERFESTVELLEREI